MMSSFIRCLIGNRNLPRDQIGILLAFVIGVTGQIIVFLIPDPLPGLAAQIPMLTPQDWPGSQISTELFISERYWPWQEMREFSQAIGIENNAVNTHIFQTVVWYADPSETIAAWDTLVPKSFNGMPLVTSASGKGKPVSMLFCRELVGDDTPRECTYLAYWEHWYTDVHLWSQVEGDLPMTEIQKIAAQVDQLLMSSPDEPCYGFLCTNSNEAQNRNQE